MMPVTSGTCHIRNIVMYSVIPHICCISYYIATYLGVGTLSDGLERTKEMNLVVNGAQLLWMFSLLVLFIM